MKILAVQQPSVKANWGWVSQQPAVQAFVVSHRGTRRIGASQKVVQVCVVTSSSPSSVTDASTTASY